MYFDVWGKREFYWQHVFSLLLFLRCFLRHCEETLQRVWCIIIQKYFVLFPMGIDFTWKRILFPFETIVTDVLLMIEEKETFWFCFHLFQLRNVILYMFDSVPRNTWLSKVIFSISYKNYDIIYLSFKKWTRHMDSSGVTAL